MDNHPAAAPAVPPALIAERLAGWHHFLRFTVANIVAVIALLIFLLLVAKVF